MVDHDVYSICFEEALDIQYVAGIQSAAVFKIEQRHRTAVNRGKMFWVVDKSYIHTPRIGRIVVDNLIIAVFYGRLDYQVFEHFAVFDFGYAEKRKACFCILYADLRNDIRHV